LPPLGPAHSLYTGHHVLRSLREHSFSGSDA
jgi:hypothetical protein